MTVGVRGGYDGRSQQVKTLLADLNGDGMVDGEDLAIVGAQFGMTNCWKEKRPSSQVQLPFLVKNTAIRSGLFPLAISVRSYAAALM